MKMHQSKYIEQMLEQFRMNDYKPKAAPSEMNVNKLTNNLKPLEDSCLYRQTVRSLIYLMTCTRLDVCYSVSMLSQFLEHPTKVHLEWQSSLGISRKQNLKV